MRNTSTRHGVAVNVVGASKTFSNGTVALQPTDLSICQGETLVLLGPSGCGKTTLLRLIAGLETPDAPGRIMFDGIDVTPLPIERRKVGMVFQSYALFPNMNVVENVAYGLRIRGIGKKERLAEASRYLDLCRISELAERRITELSGGQRQRVAIARALAVKPDVLLLDEPLTALDANLREALRGEINSLLRSLAITSVYVTHDQAEALMLGDRIAVMERGSIAQIGTPREIYATPATGFVAKFVGVSNAIHGELKGGVFRTGYGAISLPHLPQGTQTIHFRPEDVELVEADRASLALPVGSVVYLGTTQLVTLGDATDSIRALVPARTKVTAGETVGIRLLPESVRVFE